MTTLQDRFNHALRACMLTFCALLLGCSDSEPEPKANTSDRTARNKREVPSDSGNEGAADAGPKAQPRAAGMGGSRARDSSARGGAGGAAGPANAGAAGSGKPTDAGAPVPAVCTTTEQAVRSGGSGDDRAAAVAVHRDGSVYVAGMFDGTASFGDKSVTSAGVTDAFLAKYDARGVLAWVAPAGAEQYDRAFGVAIAKDEGSIYVSGVLGQTVEFQRVPPLAEGQQLYLSKYDSDGALVWTRTAKGDDMAGPAYANAVAALPDGTTYVAGEFIGNWSFGDAVLHAAGDSDVFVVKYSASGALQWAKQAGGPGRDVGSAVAVDKEGSVYVTGEYQRQARFGEIVLPDQGEHKMYLAKYKDTGDVAWVKSASEGNMGYANGNSVAVGNDGAIYVAGVVSGVATFDTATGAQLDVAGPNLLIAKYRNDATFEWARSALPSNGSQSMALAVVAGADSGLLIGGGFLGEVSLGKTKLRSIYGWTMFLARLGSDGSYQGALQVEEAQASNSMSHALAVADDCTAYTVGNYSNRWSFHASALQPSASGDAFLLRFRPDAL